MMEAMLPTGFLAGITTSLLGKAALDLTHEELEIYRVTAELKLDAPALLPPWRLDLNLAFKADFFWTPHLTPEAGMAVDEHVFRTPALIAADDTHTLILMPDPDVDTGAHSLFLDLDAPNRVFSIGLADTEVEGHVFYRLRNTTAYTAGSHTLAFWLCCLPRREENPFRTALSFYWQRWGARQYDDALPKLADLPRYVRRTYGWAFGSWKKVVWQEFERGGQTVGAPVFIVTAAQSPNSPLPPNEREARAVWNQAWFCSLRSAAGLYRHAQRTGREDLTACALKTKELALSMPQDDGLFDAVLYTEMEDAEENGVPYRRSKGWHTARLGNSDRNPFADSIAASPRHILDMCVTCDAMLDWYDNLEQDKRLYHYAYAFAQRLVRLQRVDGFTPGWVDAGGRPMGVLDNGPETAMSGVFLLRAAKTMAHTGFREAGLRAVRAVLNGPAKEGRWEDFETYWSCARWGTPGAHVARNAIYKQCNFSIYFTALAALEAYRVSGDVSFLQAGHRVLDEMLMTQSSYQPAKMPIPVVGGFGVMNGDSELNDARQSLFAPLLLEYGAELGCKEYMQRGEAALRASFVMMYCPENPAVKAQWEAAWPFFGPADYGFNMENYGHTGKVDAKGLGIGEFTIYDWGNGLASANVELVAARRLLPALEAAMDNVGREMEASG